MLRVFKLTTLLSIQTPKGVSKDRIHSATSSRTSFLPMCFSITVLAVLPTVHANPELSFPEAIHTAIQNDVWLEGSQFREQALLDESSSASRLPDPAVSLSAGNFPVDSFDIRQEPMTQLVLGVTQKFPRGESLRLTARQKREIASQEPLLRQDRSAKIASEVAQLWLTGYQAQESIRLIEQDRFLFHQLIEATRANYASALGRARQQDIIHAQLELARLDDRLSQLKLERDIAQQQLSEWIGDLAYQSFASLIPEQEIRLPLDKLQQSHQSKTALFELIENHPSLLAFSRRLQATDTGISLAKQKYKPEWGVTVSYGVRADDPQGNDRADLASIGITFDLPIFTNQRQDREVSAAKFRNESLKTEEQLLARQLMAQLGASIVQLQRLSERRSLYEQVLLPHTKDQSDASLSAYNNDDGDFSEAVRAQISLLNTKIEALSIATARQRAIAAINYLTFGYQGQSAAVGNFEANGGSYENL